MDSWGSPAVLAIKKTPTVAEQARNTLNIDALNDMV